MTLKEKFNVISCKDCDMPFCDIKCTMLSDNELKRLEQIADENAIEFAEWVMENCDRFPKEDQALILRLFKKEKGL